VKHEVTIISDDLRHEIGNKFSINGIYDEFIVFPLLPSRILKLSFYQRWLDASEIKAVTIELCGPAIGEATFRVQAKPTAKLPNEPHPARITTFFGPLDFLKEGTIEFRTFFTESAKPDWIHRLTVKVDSDLKTYV
jgi:hypothetical protein